MKTALRTLTYFARLAVAYPLTYVADVLACLGCASAAIDVGVLALQIGPCCTLRQWLGRD